MLEILQENDCISVKKWSVGHFCVVYSSKTCTILCCDDVCLWFCRFYRGKCCGNFLVRDLLKCCLYSV